MSFPSMPRNVAIGLVAMLSCLLPWCALAEPAPLEKLVLFGPEAPGVWSPAECTFGVSDSPQRPGQRALRWSVPVDHFAGEAKYPIGWPRAGISLKDRRDWSDWDFLAFNVYTTTSRAALPRDPVGMAIHAPDKDSAFHRTLGELSKDKWVEVRIPLSQMPGRGDVRLLQFHISESRYNHKDQLDLFFDQILLLRYARPAALEFAAESTVIFDDARFVAARFELAGVKAGEAAQVTCELLKEGRPIAQTVARCQRGPQRICVDISSSKMQAGEYQIAVRTPAGPAADPVTVRVVESPFVPVFRTPAK